MDDTLPTRYEQDAYGFRVEVVMELETVEERECRQRLVAARNAQRKIEEARCSTYTTPRT